MEKKEPLLGKPSTESMTSIQSIIQRPKTSPYNSPPAILCIGPNQTKFYVQRDLLQRREWIDSCSSWGSPPIDMHSIDEDTGHVLVHYLYTGAYQTLDNTYISTADNRRIEFKRALVAYFTARAYELDGLQQLAVEQIRHYGREMTTIDIFDMVNHEFPEYLDKTGWFYEYLRERAKDTFKGDCTSFVQDAFLDRINNVELNKMLVKCILELYTAMISCIVKSKADCIQTVSEEIVFGVENDPSGKALVEEIPTEVLLANPGASDDWRAGTWGDAVEVEKKGKKTKKQQDEEEGEEVERIKKEEEGTVAVVAATSGINDISLANAPAEAAVVEDYWGASIWGSSKKRVSAKQKRKQDRDEAYEKEKLEQEDRMRSEREEQERLDKEREEHETEEKIERDFTEAEETPTAEQTKKEAEASSRGSDGFFGGGSKKEIPEENKASETKKKLRAEEKECADQKEQEHVQRDAKEAEEAAAAEIARQNEESSGWGSHWGVKKKKETSKDRRARESKELIERENQETLDREVEEAAAAEQARQNEESSGRGSLFGAKKKESLKDRRARESKELIEREEQERLEREEQERIEREDQERLEREDQERFEREEQERLYREAAAAEQARQNQESSGWGSFLGVKKKKETLKERKARERKELIEREDQERLDREVEEAVEQAKKDAEESSGWGFLNKKDSMKGADEKAVEEPPLLLVSLPTPNNAPAEMSLAEDFESALQMDYLDCPASSISDSNYFGCKVEPILGIYEEHVPAQSENAILEPSSSDFPNLDTASGYKRETESGVCSARARHLLEGDMWKDCEKCRALLCQVVVQLAINIDGNGYEMVNRMLID